MKVEFHAGVADPLAYTCRLLRKAWRQGTRVVVTAGEDSLAALDRTLWTFEAQEFLPHVRLRAALSPEVLARTPVWLAAELPTHAQCPDVLVNLDAPAATPSPQLARIIEIVGTTEAWVQAGRQRWRHYRGLGLEPVSIKLGAQA